MKKIVNNEKDCTQFISEQGWTKRGGGGELGLRYHSLLNIVTVKVYF